MPSRQAAALRTACRAAGPATLVTLLPALVAVLLPLAVQLHGDRLLLVTGGSMEPTLRVGESLLVRQLDGVPDVGQVVTYRAGGTGAVTTHRVVEVLRRDDGAWLRTKGDANLAPDPDLTAARDVGWTAEGAWPLGEQVAMAQSRAGRLLAVGPALVMLAVWQLLALWQGGPPRAAAAARRAGVVPPAASRPRRRPSRPPHDAPVRAGVPRPRRPLEPSEPRDRARRGAGSAAALLVVVALVVTAGTGPGASRTLAVLTDAAPVGGATFTTAASFAGSCDPGRYPTAVRALAPHLYWRLEEVSGSAAADDRATRPATYRGGPELGRAGALCDSSRAVGFSPGPRLVSADAVSAPQDVLSVGVWFRTTQPGGKMVGFGNRNTVDSSNNDRHLYTTATGQVVFGTYPGTHKSVMGAGSYADGAWHLAVGTVGPAGLTLYVDGQRVARNTAVTTAQTYTGYWRAGQDKLSSSWPGSIGGSGQWVGDLDEVFVVHSQLSDGQVADLWAASGR